MSLPHRRFFSTAMLALALAGMVPAYAAMPARPTLRVTTLDGKSYDLASQRGHWVIVNFWATWCAPCIKEMPDISRFVATHRNVSAIGLAYDDSTLADIRAFVAKHPVIYPIAQVPLDKAPKDFDEPRGLPTTYVIDPQGRLAKTLVGPVNATVLSAVIGSQ